MIIRILDTILKKYKSSDIKTITGVPLEVAKKIYSNDSWFNGQKDTYRYIKLSLEGSNLKVDIKRDNPNDGTHHKINKTRSDDDGSKEYLLRLAFSVNGNKGPYDYFVENLKGLDINKVKHMADVDKALMAHFAYLTGYGANNDDTFINILKKAKLDAKYNNDKDRQVFCDILKKNKKHLVKHLVDKIPLKLGDDSNVIDSINQYISAYRSYYSEHNASNDNLKMDLTNANLYIKNLGSGYVGGSNKTKRKRLSKRKKRGTIHRTTKRKKRCSKNKKTKRRVSKKK